MRNQQTKDKIPFTQIPNELITDDISAGAKSVYMYMQSKPDDWEFWNRDIMKALKIKTNETISKYLQELLIKGWVSRKRKKKGGKFSGGYDYKVHFGRKVPYTGKVHIWKDSKYGKTPNHTNTNSITNTNYNTNKDINTGKIEDLPELANIKNLHTLHVITTDFIKYQSSVFGKKVVPSSRKTIINSIKTLDEIQRIDGKSIDEIKGTLNFALKNDFWYDKIFSLATLRKRGNNKLRKFDNIYVRAGKDLKEKLNKKKQKEREFKLTEEWGI